MTRFPTPLSNKKKVFRQDRMKKNAMPWAIGLVILLAWFGLSLLPQWKTWLDNRSELKNQTATLSLLEKDVAVTNAQLADIEKELEEASKDIRSREADVLPEKIDSGKIAKILELYALSLESLDTKRYDSHFVLNRVNFGQTNKQKESPVSETSVTVEISTDKQNLKTFVDFLQNGILTERFQQIKNDDENTYKFLEQNALPLAHISAIKIDPKDGSSQHYEAEIDITFFSQ